MAKGLIQYVNPCNHHHPSESFPLTFVPDIFARGVYGRGGSKTLKVGDQFFFATGSCAPKPGKRRNVPNKSTEIVRANWAVFNLYPCLKNTTGKKGKNKW